MPETLIEPPINYRRIARRVRCQHRHDPIGKQHALASLARRVDRLPRLIEADLAPTPDSGVRAFAKAVSQAMDGPILRFSRRQELIRQAEGLGIRRFDANLLIAAVQHRLGSERSMIVAEPAPAKNWQWGMGAILSAVIGLQGIILLAAWGLFHS